MTHPVLGTWSDGSAVKLDLPRLIETRMLIQSNSGGGKSRALRRLLEVTSGKVQQLIIDPEGEFASLREKHDLVICAAQGGDAASHPRTAVLLGRRLLEVEASAVLDISELKAPERHAFVRLFLESLIEAPKSLRHSVLVVIDECQIYSPEKGQGESEASAAVIDLATRGRKRGLSLIAATQRISMLHKAVAGECKNRLIGGTSLDVDVKRAAFDLGLPPKDALEQLRALEPGHFFAFGPALRQLAPREMATGDVLTTHPKVGHQQWTVPPKPTAAIVALLPKLSDLPKEAAQEAKSLEDLRRELATTRRELTLAKKGTPISGPSRQDLTAAEQRGYDRGRTAGVQEVQRAAAAHLKSLRSVIHKAVESALSVAPEPIASRSTQAPAQTRTVIPRSAQSPMPRERATNDSGEFLGRCETKILTVLAQFPEGCEIGKLTLLTGYRKSGGFLNSLSTLRTAGLMEGANTGTMHITEEGLARGPFTELPQGEELLRYWLEHPSFGVCERKILTALSEAHDGLTAEEICEVTGYAKSGGFLNSLGNLRTAGVLVGRNTETMRLNETIA